MRKKAVRLGALLLTAVLSASVFAGCAKKAEVESLPQFDQEIKQGEEIAVITVKDYGQIKIRFFPDKAPKAVENFIELAKQGYYDELNFHRVIKDFMIQGGDPKGDGTGGESFMVRMDLNWKSTTIFAIFVVRCPWPTADRTPTAASFLSFRTAHSIPMSSWTKWKL